MFCLYKLLRAKESASRKVWDTHRNMCVKKIIKFPAYYSKYPPVIVRARYEYYDLT